MADYPSDWDTIARRVKSEAGWRCVRCRHAHDSRAGYQLGVHHLNGQKDDCVWFNLVPLCQRCHLRIQGKVDLDRPWVFEHSDWFKPYVAGHYARRYLGEILTRAAVMDRLAELLALEAQAVIGGEPIPLSAKYEGE